MYTLYKVIMAIINLVKYKKVKSPLLSSAKVVNLVAALMSVLGLQAAMIAAFSKNQETFRFTINAVTGGAMPAKSNTNPAKTPIFTSFLSNSRLKYIQYVGVRLCQKSSKMAAFWLPASLTPMFLGKTRRASALILDV